MDTSLFEKYKNLPRGSPKKERKDDHRIHLIETAKENINKERDGTKWKKVSFMAVKMKVRHLDDWDLGMFVSQCEKADSFSKVFFGALKIRTVFQKKTVN